MKRLLFIVCSMVAASSLFGATESNSSNEVKIQHNVGQDEGVKMSDEEWGKAQAKMLEERDEHALAARELTRAEQHISHRRWIEREGGWGIPVQIDLPITTYWGYEGVTNLTGIMQTGVRIGISKRQFHKNLELRALTGLGYGFMVNRSDKLTGGYYFPLNLEVGWAKDWDRTPTYVLGLSYETSSIFNKSEVYFNYKLSGQMFLHFSYGLSGSLKFGIGDVKATDIYGIGVLAAW